VEAKTAVLVIDAQPAFMKPDPMLTSDGDDLLAKLTVLDERARAANLPVIYIEHIGFGRDRPPDDLIPTHRRIGPRPGDLVIQKLFEDSFAGTPLQTELAQRGVHRLVIAGYATHQCVNAAAVHARCLGYDVVVVEDAHACQDYAGKTAGEIVALFNTEWQKLGVRLVKAGAISFSRL
jgi:nicotinamidase-related amidase